MFALGDIVAQMPAAIYRSTPDGRFVAGNRALASLIGAPTVESLTDIDIRTLYRFPARRDDLIARINAGEDIGVETQELVRLDGTTIWVRIHSHPVFDDAGELAYFEGFMEDVSTLHEAEQMLRQSNALLDSLTQMQNRFIAGVDVGELFDGLLDELLSATESEYGFIAQLLHDDNGPFLRTWAMTDISWNEATRKMYDTYGPRGMEFHNLDTLFGRVVTTGMPVISNEPRRDRRAAGRPDGHPPLNSFFAVPIRRGDEIAGMVAIANRPGGYEERMIPLLDPLAAAVGSLIEASVADRERRAAEQTRADVEALYGAVLQEAGDAVVAFTDDGRIVTANRAAEELLGLAGEALIGTHMLRYLPSEQTRRFWERGVRAAASGSTMDAAARRADGAECPVNVSIVRTTFADRPITVLLARDIAARAAAEEALREAKDAAIGAARAKDELLATMSHELRTPLNSVIGLSVILQRDLHGELNAKQREYVAQIESSGRHLLEVITSILELAKMEAGKLDATLEPVDAAALVEDAIAVMAPLAEHSGLHVDIDTTATLLPIAADPLRAKQLLLNLLSNAVKFTDPGGTIGVRARPHDEGVEISVWDTGVGIPPDRLGDIFDPFEQVDSSLSRRYPGTGLGLALSRRLAELQHAQITVKSIVGEGSEFTVIFPTARVTGSRSAPHEPQP